MEGIELRLNCEKLTKYKNLINKSVILNCPECNGKHSVNVEETLEMPINSEIIKRKQIELALEELTCKNISIEIDDHFKNLKNEIDLHAEQLMKRINDYRIEMIEKVEQKRIDILKSPENVALEKLNKDNFKKKLNWKMIYLTKLKSRIVI